MTASSNARLVRAFFCLSLLFGALVAAAADSPSPVRLIVAGAADGGASLQARVLADALRRQTGRPFLTDHRSGLAGESATAVVARSAADGEVLLLAGASLAVRAAGLLVQTDELRGLKAVGQVSSTPLVLVLHPRVPAQTLTELNALARARGNLLQAGAGSAGGLGHLAAALLLPPAAAARTLTFRGSGPAVRALAEGRVDLLFAAAPALLWPGVAERLRLLAVTAPSPHPVLARLPLLGDAMPGFVDRQWHALFAPAGTPDGMVSGLQRAMALALRDPAVMAHFDAHAVTAVGGDGAALDGLLQSEIARYAPLIRRTALVP